MKKAVARVQKCIPKALDLSPVAYEPPEVVTGKMVISREKGLLKNCWRDGNREGNQGFWQ